MLNSNVLDSNMLDSNMLDSNMLDMKFAGKDWIEDRWNCLTR